MSDHACKPPGTWRYAIYVIVNDCHVAANYGLHLELHYYIHTVLIFHTFSTTICVFCRFSSSLPTKLLHLIEQQHTVGSASNRLSELATFLSYGSTTNPLDPLVHGQAECWHLIANISRWSASQTRDCELLHVL